MNMALILAAAEGVMRQIPPRENFLGFPQQLVCVGWGRGLDLPTMDGAEQQMPQPLALYRDQQNKITEDSSRIYI